MRDTIFMESLGPMVEPEVPEVQLNGPLEIGVDIGAEWERIKKDHPIGERLTRAVISIVGMPTVIDTAKKISFEQLATVHGAIENPDTSRKLDITTRRQVAAATKRRMTSADIISEAKVSHEELASLSKPETSRKYPVKSLSVLMVSLAALTMYVNKETGTPETHLNSQAIETAAELPPTSTVPTIEVSFPEKVVAPTTSAPAPVEVATTEPPAPKPAALVKTLPVAPTLAPKPTVPTTVAPFDQLHYGKVYSRLITGTFDEEIAKIEDQMGRHYEGLEREKFIGALLRYNGFKDATEVQVGMTISNKVCPADADNILSGDTVATFAARNNVSVDSVTTKNPGFINRALLCLKV